MSDHLDLAASIGAALAKRSDIANVTDVQGVGERNPTASFTVVGNNGSVCSVVVKRLMMGQVTAAKAKVAKSKEKRGK